MKTTTTTREFDADGKLTRETIVEEEKAPAAYVPTTFAPNLCNCWNYTGYVEPHYCPVHGYRSQLPYTVTCSTAGTSSTDNKITLNGGLRTSNAG